MADITMCTGENCPLKEKCYRYRARPSEKWQSYFVEVPYNHDKEKCDEYWEAIDEMP